MREIAIVAVGGAVGCVARHVVNLLCMQLLADRFRLGILLVNVVGCLLIGLVGEGLAKHANGEWLRLLIMTGFLGGLTTFSSFGYDTVRQLERGDILAAAVNIGGNLLLGLAAVTAGIWLAKQWLA